MPDTDLMVWDDDASDDVDVTTLDYSNVDVERLRRVIKTIEAEPETFDMAQWAQRYEPGARYSAQYVEMGFEQPNFCGTTMCLAGHVVADEGLDSLMDFRPVVGATGIYEVQRLNDGRRVENVATALLGLPKPAAELLFLSTHIETADELWGLIERMTDGAVTKEDRV